MSVDSKLLYDDISPKPQNVAHMEGKFHFQHMEDKFDKELENPARIGPEHGCIVLDIQAANRKSETPEVGGLMTQTAQKLHQS